MIDVFILVLLPLTLKDQYRVDKNLATVNSNVHLATHVFGFLQSLLSMVVFETVGIEFYVTVKGRHEERDGDTSLCVNV